MKNTEINSKTTEELIAENAELRSKKELLEQEKERLEREKEEMERRIAFLEKTVFGSKSEKKILKQENSAQMSLFDEAENECRMEEVKAEPETVTVPEHKRKKKRTRDEIMKELPTEEVVHTVDDTACEICGSEMKPVGKEFVHDELVYVHAKIFRAFPQRSCSGADDPRQLLLTGAACAHHILKIFPCRTIVQTGTGSQAKGRYPVPHHNGELDHSHEHEKGGADLCPYERRSA